MALPVALSSLVVLPATMEYSGLNGTITMAAEVLETCTQVTDHALNLQRAKFEGGAMYADTFLNGTALTDMKLSARSTARVNAKGNTGDRLTRLLNALGHYAVED